MKEKIRKGLALCMTFITLSFSVFQASAISVQAAQAIPLPGNVAIDSLIVEAFSVLVAAELGLGYSAGKNEAITQETRQILAAATTGATITIVGYGEVNFSDSDSIYNWLNYCAQYNDYSLGHFSATSQANYSALDSVALALDRVSYTNTGTAATAGISASAYAVVKEYKDAIKRQQLANAVGSLARNVFSGNNNDKRILPSEMLMIKSLISAALLTGVTNQAVLKTKLAKFTEFTDYSYIFDDAYHFTGSFSDGKIRIFRFNNGKLTNVYNSFTQIPEECYLVKSSTVVNHSSSNYSYASPCYELFGANGAYGSVGFNVTYSGSDYVGREFIRYLEFTDSGHGEKFVLQSNLPIFLSEQDRLDYYRTGDLNYVYNGFSVSKFKNAVKPATYALNPAIDAFVRGLPSANNVKALAESLADSDTEALGTAAALPAVAAKVEAATAALPAVEETEPEFPGVNNTSLFGILGSILAAIKMIAAAIWALFQHPVLAIQNGIAAINTGINDLGVHFAEWYPNILARLASLPGDIVLGLSDMPLAIGKAVSDALALAKPLVITWDDVVIDALTDALAKVGVLAKAGVISLADAIALALADAMALVVPYVKAIAAELALPKLPGGDNPEAPSPGGSFFNLINVFILLIMILIVILRIFLHLLTFVVNIYKIPASPGLLNSDMVSGLNFLKSIQIPGVGIGLYDILLGTAYVVMVFYVVKVLRHNIYHIHIPGTGRR